LNVSRAELRSWLAGKEAVPLSVFNRVMHLVNRAYREETARRRLRIH
jgi:hypothetical protein